MKYILVVSILFSFTACKQNENLNLPVLIPSEADSILSAKNNEMTLAESIIYGINIKDSLDFSKEKKSPKKIILLIRINIL